MDCFDATEPWFAEDDIECATAIKYLKPAWGAYAAYFDGSEPSSCGFDFGAVGDTDAC
jgi:hypothetical protein